MNETVAYGVGWQTPALGTNPACDCFRKDERLRIVFRVLKHCKNKAKKNVLQRYIA